MKKVKKHFTPHGFSFSFVNLINPIEDVKINIFKKFNEQYLEAKAFSFKAQINKIVTDHKSKLVKMHV